PVAGESSGGSGGGIPLKLDIAAIDLPDIDLAAPVAGAPARLAATGRVLIDGTPLDIAADLDVHRIDAAAGQLTLSAKFSPDSGAIRLDATASEPKGGIVAGLFGLPDDPALSLTVTGNGNLDDFAADLALSLDGTETIAGRLTVGAVEAGHAVTADLNGQLTPFVPGRFRPALAGRTTLAAQATIGTDGSVTVPSATLTSATTALDLSGMWSKETVSAKVRATVAAGTRLLIETDGGAPLDLEDVRLAVTADGTAKALDWTLALDAATLGRGDNRLEGLTLQASGKGANPSGPKADFTVKGTAESVVLADARAAAFANGLVRLSATGTVEGTDITLSEAQITSDTAAVALTGSGNWSTMTVDANITADVQPGLPLSAATWLRNRPARLTAHVAAKDGTVSVSDARLEAALATVTGSGRVADGALDGSMKIAAPDLSAVQAGLTGAADLDVTLGGTLSAPTVKATASGNAITVMGEALDGLGLTLDAVLDPAAPQGTLKAEARYRGQPVLADIAVVRGADGSATIEPATVTIAGATVKGSATWGPDGPNGRFALDAPDLAALGPILLRDDLSGALSGTATLNSDAQGSTLALKLDGPALSAAGVSAKTLAIGARIDDLLGKARPTATITAASLVASGTTVTGLKVEVQPKGGAIAFSVEGRADGTPVSAAGTVTPGATTAIALDRANAVWRGVEARLARPTTVRIADGAVTLNDAALALGGGTATITGSAGKSLNLKVALSGISAAVAEAVAPGLGLQGPISGSVGVTGAAADPKVAYELTWSGASASATRDASLGALNVAAKGSYGGKAVTLDSRIDGPAGLAFTASGRVGLAGTPTPDIAVRGTIPFELAAAKLASSGMRLKGAANADLKIAGTAAAPAITGTISTSGATFVDTGSNIVLTDLAAQAALGGRSIEIRSLTGKIASGGTLSASGTIGLDNGLPADIAVKVSDGRYADGQLVNAVFGANITVKGPLASAPVLGGQIDIDRADLTIPDNLPGGVDIVSVQHRNAPAAVAEQAQELKSGGGGGGSALTLDLAVNAPRRIFVRGRGIDAEFGGRIKLVGPASAPRAIGAFNLIRGRMNLLARRLDFTSGTIGFTGSLVPDIDFSADTTTSDGTATLTLSGPANKPEISASSASGVPEDEALALIIFGRTTDNLSAFQIAQLADAVATLSGGGSGSVLEKLRRSVGIDSLDVTAGDNGQGAAVSAGRYINDRTFVGVKQGTQPGSTRVTIDLNITDDVKVRGETGANGTTKGGIFFERDY
ncbi:MAG: translocation/assembly module TamB domain-containing protein, partial [Rhodobiaceae bacterium]|nr:translocation/assembly module TamB domain-containing protein [Rhodobiaceae bacterium]